MTIDELEKLAREDSPNKGSKVAVRCFDLLALMAVARAAEEFLDAVYPILNLDCEVHGTCRDCLEDGHGSHTDQAEYQSVVLRKALRNLEGGDV